MVMFGIEFSMVASIHDNDNCHHNQKQKLKMHNAKV